VKIDFEPTPLPNHS